MEDGGGLPTPSGFLKIIDRMKPLLRELQESSSHSIKDGLGNFLRKGVYAFYEDGKAIYAGRYNRMRNRIRDMEVRAVATEDQAVPAVFEIYAILAFWPTKYNSFQTT